MSLSTSNFSLQQLEARFEMQCMDYQQDAGHYYQQDVISDGCGGGGGSYDYYGNSWGDAGSGEGYVGTYQTSSDGSYAILDDGSYTDGTSGDFPSYDQDSGAMASTEYNGSADADSLAGPNGIRVRSFCVICRCRF